MMSAEMLAGDFGTSEDLFHCYLGNHNVNPNMSISAAPQETPAAAYHGKTQIPDITEIEQMGKPTLTYPTPEGAKYENQTKIEGKYSEYPIMVRRVHPLDDDKPQVKLRIQSQSLKDFLKQLPHSALALPVHKFPMELDEPYQGIFHLKDEIAQAQSHSQSLDLSKGIAFLKKFQDDYMHTTISEINELLDKGQISFAYLWALYKPGELVALWRLTDTGPPNYWLAHVQRFTRFEQNEEVVWKVEVLSTAIRGDRVGSERNTFEFPQFPGTVNITELPVIPLRCLKNRKEIQEVALKRATLYQGLMLPLAMNTTAGHREPPAHWRYKGPVWVPQKDPTHRQPDNFSWIFGRRKGQEGCRFFDPASCNVSLPRFK